MILLGCRDEHRVNIHADHPVTGAGQEAAQPAGPAAGIEDVGTTGHHRVDEARFAGQILTGACHGTKPFDIPL